MEGKIHMSAIEKARQAQERERKYRKPDSFDRFLTRHKYIAIGLEELKAMIATQIEDEEKAVEAYENIYKTTLHLKLKDESGVIFGILDDERKHLRQLKQIQQKIEGEII